MLDPIYLHGYNLNCYLPFLFYFCIFNISVKILYSNRWYSSHLGSIIPFGENIALKYQREIKTNHDGTQFAVDWYPSKPTYQESKSSDVPVKICVFIPGLGLSSNNKFCMNFVQKCHEDKVYCAVITHRGLGIPLNNSKY
jgi:hypothetical protein